MKKKKLAAAVELGRLGGLKGGPARAAKLTAKRRTQIARNAALARWSKEQSKFGGEKDERETILSWQRK